jgi:hypothetical protein
VSRFAATPLLAAILSVALGSIGVAQTVAAVESPADFRSLLLEAGFSAEELAALADWDVGELSDSQADVVSRLLFRLQAAGEGLAASDRLDVEPGQLVSVEGRAVSATPVDLPAAVQGILEQKQLMACTVRRRDGSTVVVLSRQVPAAWGRRAAGTPLDEPVKFRGVFLGTAKRSDSDRTQSLVLAQRLQWFPVANVSAGVAWLVEHGFNAALLDEVRHGQPFARTSESLEAKAFYTALATVAASPPAELVRLVRDRLPAVAKSAELAAADAAERRSELTAQLETTPPATQKKLQAELTELRRRQALATQVAERAKRGHSSTWPMFLEPERNTGDAFLIEGTARRAVRIVVENPTVEPDASPRLREYYELDLFTTDSQNQPVICCVARLPDGFPTGELIREPVRVAGLFFKKWSYARRSDDQETGGDSLPARLAPPVLLAAEPEWLQTAGPAGPSPRGLWGGAAFAGVVAVLWIILARVARRDRLARAQRARYDASLDKLAEP